MSGKTYVADAGALLAFLKKEPGWQAFRDLLRQPEVVCYAHAANLAEVFYDTRRFPGEDTAQEALRRLADTGILFREDFERAFWQDAARIKADHRRVSLADCFGLALARRVACPFLSTDHHELDAICAAGVCAVEFIR